MSHKSPLASLVASAIKKGHPGQIEAGKQVPCQGCYRHILVVQGSNAAEGARRYVHDGKMTGGFALVAWPAIYAALGVVTFSGDQDGVVFQSDLGRDTGRFMTSITVFDPDVEWKRVDVTASASSSTP